MFDLKKDIEKYKGVPPYASELYGVYQPLLGWESNLTKKWAQRNGSPFDPRVKRILDGHIVPGPTHLFPGTVDYNVETSTAVPLQPGHGKSPYRVLLAKELNSELIKLARDRVQGFVETHDGLLPDGRDEWLQVININHYMDGERNDMQIVNDLIRQRLFEEAVRSGEWERQDRRVLLQRLEKKHLELMQYESQIAAFLIFHAEAQVDYDPNELKNLFTVRKAPSLKEILRSNDPLAMIDPLGKGALSPVGFVHLFRQYFFDLGTFLGEPVEHVWLAPGTTIELVEVSTRRVLVERILEEALEQTTRAEQSTASKDELSDAVKEENESSTKFGVSNTNTVNLYVYQGTVSTSFDLSSTRRNSRETAHKQNREQSEKLSSEIKRSYKSVFKTVTETTDTRSRRYVIQNTGDKLVNYELRRKMRRVGVQVQDIGQRLCWQMFIDNPGENLGLGELVHFAPTPELDNLKEPEKIPSPTTISKKVIVPLAYKPVLDYSNNRAQYEFQGPAPNGVLLGIIKGDEDDDDSQIVMEFRGFRFDPPQTGYTFNGQVNPVGVQGNKLAIIRAIEPHVPTGTFDIIMQRVNFGGENIINLEMEVYFAPSDEETKRVAEANKKANENYDAEKQRLIQKSYMESVRDRINDASNIRSRPSWDLREEERTIVYRKLIKRLMLDSWNVPATDENNRVSHVRSEIIRTIFDVDAMLYFVAPEWWMPRRRKGQHAPKNAIDLDIAIEDKTYSLTDEDIVAWGGEKRTDNYRITEDSTPAKLGSSLGWLLQLDGDNLRNAFLNAPWVKAVIPIRPGRETAALNWLRSIEGHDQDGWNTPYLGTAEEDAEFQGKTVGEVLDIIAERLQAQNSNIQHVLEADKVFEYGFDHLANGFDAGLDANQVFSQWVSILPTDQIVAVDYTPTDLLADE